MPRTVLPYRKLTAQELDQLIAVFQDPENNLDTLPEDQQRRILLLSTAHDLRQRYKLKRKIVPMLQKFCQVRFKLSLSQRSAYQVMYDSSVMFCSQHLSSKDADRIYFAEDVREVMELCKAKGDYNAYARNAELYIKAMGFDKEDDDSEVPDPVPVIIKTDVSLLGPNQKIYGDAELQTFLNGFLKKPRQRTSEPIQDVEHEEVDGS